jgi:rimK-like ATP-grasp domain
MILLIAREFDYFADCVCNWLTHFGITNIIRITTNSQLSIDEIDIKAEKVLFSVDNQKVSIDEVKLFWYMGGEFPMPFYTWKTKDQQLALQLERFVDYEWKMLQEYILGMLQKKEHIGNYFYTENKLKSLVIAKSCGLSIPDTYITQSAFSEILREGCSYISKPIGECFPFIMNKKVFRMYTTEVPMSYFAKNKCVNHFPSLLQQKIEVDFEIRVFVFFELKKFYSMAIFSKAETDYRQNTNTNRYAPYSLPDEIKERILLFMEKAKLDTASFDLVKSKTGDYIFVEVNPFGNIEMINETCGYGIDREFAEVIYDKYCRILQ